MGGVAQPTSSPLGALALRQLDAAELLWGQGLVPTALGLVAQAMLARAAVDAGRRALPEADAAVWLYAEGVPGGFVGAETAHAILCAQGLSRAAEVPGELAASLFDQARVHVRRSLVA